MSKKTTRGPAAQVLLDAHLAFELAQWRGPNAPARLREAIDAFWVWAGRTPLAQIASRQTLRAAATRLVLDGALPRPLAGVIGAVANDLARRERHHESQVQDVIDRRLFDDGVDLFIGAEGLRNRVLEGVLASPLYTALATDLLYQGIKGYIFSDVGAINAFPGVSRLIKGSTQALSKRLPGLEAEIDKRVRAYIEANAAKILARSQRSLVNTLDGARIRALAAELWDSLHDRPVSIAGGLDTGDPQRLVDFGLRLWAALRETEYVGALVDAAVTAYFEAYGELVLTETLGYAGIDRELLLRQAETMGPALIAGLDDLGLLEDWLRRRLAAFYDSPAFAAAFAAATKK